MKSILSSGLLRASDALQMDDSEELVYALDVARPITEEQKNGSPRYFIPSIAGPEKVRQVLKTFKTYIACFSEDRGIPSQWQDYADQSRGCVIGFDRKETLNLCMGLQIPGPSPMLYGLPTQQGMIRHFLELGTQLRDKRGLKQPVLTQFRDRGLVYLVSLLMAVKSPCWSYQREWRVLEIEDVDPLPFGHGCNPKGRPFIELPICTPQTVVEVVLGSKFDRSIDAVQSFLAGAGFSDARVSRSDLVLS
jgi:hypothetical protein